LLLRAKLAIKILEIEIKFQQILAVILQLQVLLFVSDYVGVKPSRYSLVWDNTQKLVVARNQSRKGMNKMLLWANAFAAKNRVHCDPEALTTGCRLEARDIPPTAYLPSADDYSSLRGRMAVIVSRIIVHHVPFFTQHFSSTIVHHVDHQHSSSSAVKSELVM